MERPEYDLVLGAIKVDGETYVRMADVSRLLLILSKRMPPGPALILVDAADQFLDPARVFPGKADGTSRD